MNINEETHPHITELVDTKLHHEVIETVKEYLDVFEGLNKEEILEKIDVCYDENNIPSTIYIDTIAQIVADVDDFETYLDEQWALANVDKFKDLNEKLNK